MEKRLPNPVIDVERELSLVVGRVGGCRVDDITGPKPGHKIADFLFDSYQIVAELKCLDKDQINDPGFVRKLSGVYLRQAEHDKSLPRVLGTVQMTTEGMSRDFQLQIAGLYAVPIQRVIASADEQIAVTKSKLARPGHRGVLLLVNEGNTAVHPAHVLWTLGECLRDPSKFTNINHVIFFTANMSVDISESHLPSYVRDMDLHVWYSGGRGNMARIDAGFEPALRAAWFEHMRVLTGRCEQFDGTSEALHETKNKPIERK